MSTKKAEKKSKAAKKPEEMKNLPWNDQMVLALLKVVYETKAHLQTHNKNVSIYWHNVTTKFFDQPDCIIFKDKHLAIDPDSKQADYRKLRDKYNKVIETVQLDIEKGNQSGKEGDLSPLYKLVKLINDEIDVQDDEKATAKENAASDKHQLGTNEVTVLSTVGKKRNSNTAIRVRAADGTITVDAEREKKQQNKAMNQLDAVMIKMINDKFNPSSESSVAPVQSRTEKVLGLMSTFVEDNYYCTESFLRLAYRVTNAPPPEDLLLELQLIGGLEMLLSLYCSNEDNFSATSPIPSSLSVSSSGRSADISALTSVDRSNDTTPPFNNDLRVTTHNLSSENAIGSVADPHIDLQSLQEEIDTALCSTVLGFELPQTSSSHTAGL